MHHETGTFAAADGLDLHYQSWRPEGAPKATLLLIHGLGGHSGASMGLVTPLVAAGYAVFAPDMRGHGASPGLRGHIMDWSEYREDLYRFEAHVALAEPTRPRILIGHSLGGLMAIDYALHHPEGLSGLALITPAVAPSIPVWQRLMVRLLAGLKPTFTITERPDYAPLTDNLEVQAEIAADSLRHGQKTIGLGAALLKTTSWVERNAGRLQLPTLVQYAEADTITPPAGIARFTALLGGAQVTARLYPGLRHRPFDDHAGRVVVDDMLAWLAER
jgi:alpha-beta hydrolase superfamily lysophospholipase